MKKLFIISAIIGAFLLGAFVSDKPPIIYKGEKYVFCYSKVDTLAEYGSLLIVRETVYDHFGCENINR